MRGPRSKGAALLMRTRAVTLAAHMAANGDTETETEPGRTFVYWLAQACKSARTEGGLTQKDIPAVQSRVSRFEIKAKWPESPEDLVQAYAQALGIRDSRMLWDLALELWLEHGQPPRPIEESRQVPAIPEGQLLQRLREGLPTDRARRQRKSRQADGQSDRG